MPTPVVYSRPIKRPGFISGAQFTGDNDRLDLELQYTDSSGIPRTLVLPCCRNPDDAQDPGAICLPSSKGINDLKQDALISHLRMSTFITGFLPGSTEWIDAFMSESEASHIQTAIGTVRVLRFEPQDDQIVHVIVAKSGSLSIERTLVTDYSELSNYSFAPGTQLLCVAGAIEKQFPSYVHFPSSGQVLSTNQKSDIVSYVQTLDQWI